MSLKNSARHFYLVLPLLLTLTAALSIAFSLPTRAEVLAGPVPKFTFWHILSDELESIGYVTAIAQDIQGFMWFGGSNGLARYDGYELKVYRQDPELPGSLRHSYINSILLSRRGELWIGTQAGLHRYNPKTDTFSLFGHESEALYGPSVNDVRVIFEDSRDRLWLGTANGLNRFHPETAKFTRYFYPAYPTRGGDSAVQAIAEDQSGTLWLGNHTSGLTRFDPETSIFEHFRHDPNDSTSLSHNDVRALLVDREDVLWVGTHGGGLNKLAKDRRQFERLSFDASNKSDIIWSIVQGRDGDIWIGDGGAVGLLEFGAHQYRRYPHSAEEPESPGNHVANVLFLDRARDIWVGYFPTGVDLIDHQSAVFHNYVHSATNANSVSDGGILSTYEDDQRNLWFGAGYGLSYLDRQSHTFRNFRHRPGDNKALSGDTVLAIAGDQEGYVWLGIWSRGLDRYDPGSGEFRHYVPQGDNPRSLLGSEPWALTVDHEGVLWVATERGVNRYNRATDDFTHFVPRAAQMEGDSFFYTRAILEDSKHNLWIGSIRGLFKLDRSTGEFERFRHEAGNPESLSNDYVRALYEDSRGALWVGTFGGGLNRYDPTTGLFEHFGRSQGLPDDVVTSIIEDPEGAIWVSTHKGLARFNPETETFRIFQKRHGLPGNLFNSNTATRTSTGELVFGSSKGATVFKPAALAESSYVPPIVITDFQVFNKPVAIGPNSALRTVPSQASEIHLQHAQSVFSFTFAALNFRAPEENHYSYKLEGFDRNWHDVGRQRSATYTNLDPGHYVFRVRGSSNERLWNQEGTAVKVYVAPPLWRTPWAYLLYVLLTALLLYLVFKLLVGRQAYAREHTLNKRLQELDKLKDQFLANTSHELRTPLNGIIGLSESLLEGVAGPVPEPMKKHLQMIAFSGKRLAHLVNDILDYSKLKTHSLQLNLKPLMLHAFAEQVLEMIRPLAGAKPLVLNCKVADDLPPVLVDESRLQQIFYNVLGNAIKFTDRGAVTVSASLLGDMVAVDISDTGMGIAAEQIDKIFQSFEQADSAANRKRGGTGLGLAITKRLVELHGGSISVRSTVGVGSSFRILLPVAAGPY